MFKFLGALVTLSEDGHLQCSYLGTEPELFSAPPMSLKPIDYEEAKLELENLHAIIKSNTDSAGMLNKLHIICRIQIYGYQM